METPLRPLGIVMELVKGLGHEITYAYDDLVFVDHNDFLLQFNDESNSLDLFFNTECPADEADEIAGKIMPEAMNMGLVVNRKGTYEMTEASDSTLQIAFNP
ncbi:MAG: hypothetical protein HGB00_07645 [Chlorobiaceae bacterium]|nr:hypothetical protein [Chlorobiaceae bacterium]